VIWKKFRRYAEYITDEVHKSRKAGVDLPKKSLSMPHQKDETSSMEEC